MLSMFVLTDANEATYPIGFGSNFFTMIDRFKLSRYVLSGTTTPPPPPRVKAYKKLCLAHLYITEILVFS